MMKRITLMLLLILLSFSVYSYEDDDLLLASQAKLYLNINSSFEIQKLSNHYNIEHVTIKLSYIPLESYRQRVVSHITNPKAEEHEDYLVYRWENPAIGKEKFRSEYVMTTGTAFFPIKNKVDFPIQKIPKEVIKYTQSTEYIDINKDIETLANELMQGKTDLYEIVFDAAVWVNNNIEYDLSTVTSQASLPSSWVLKEKRGVCDEMTNLFISILRSLGIPARFVSGISYTNSPLFTERWGPHGWAEVYFPDQGWVPFDPTYGQYGYIDSGHIKLKESVDSDKSSIEYEWLSYGVSIEGNSPTNKVQIIEKIGKYDPQISMDLKPLNKKVGFGSYNVITATIKNNADEYRPLKLSLVAPKEAITYIKDKYVLLKPKEEKIIDWKIKFPSDLKKRSIYTFPFSVVSNLNNSFSTDVTVSSGSMNLDENYVDSYMDSRIENLENLLEISLLCEHEKSLEANQKIDVVCTIEEKDDQIIVCLENDCKNPTEGAIKFTKSYNKPGVYPLIVIAKKNNKQKSYYSQILVNDKPRVSIEWDEFNKSMDYDQKANMVFSLKQESISTPRQLSLEVGYNNQIRTMEIENLRDTQLFQFQLRGSELDAGENIIIIKATYYDEDGNLYNQEFTENITMQTNNLFELIIVKINKFLNYLAYHVERLLN